MACRSGWASKSTTLSPACSKRRARCAPINPVPPVIMIAIDVLPPFPGQCSWDFSLDVVRSVVAVPPVCYYSTRSCQEHHLLADCKSQSTSDVRYVLAELPTRRGEARFLHARLVQESSLRTYLQELILLLSRPPWWLWLNRSRSSSAHDRTVIAQG